MKFAKRILAFVLIFATILTYNTFSLDITSNAATDTYKQSLLDAGFPESYAEKLATLHELHPNWAFEPIMVTKMNSKLTWDYVVASENSASGNSYYNLVTTSSWAPSKWLSLGNANYSPYYDANNTTLYDSGWRKASKEAVEYFMDPRNFLNPQDIFMFEYLGYNESTHTIGLVNDALSGTFMINANCDNNVSYAQLLVNVASAHNISPVFLASRLKQEQGTGASPLVNGTIGTTLLSLYNTQSDYDSNGKIVWGSVKKGTTFTEAELLQYEGYYNFFNIEASGTGVFAIYLNGGKEAVAGNWTSKAAAISGGAKKIKQRYIDDYQYTLYLQKFNVHPSSSRLLWGQYMQNIAAPLTEGRNAYNTYNAAGLLDEAHVFKIPVYSGMPAECFDPADGISYFSPSCYHLSISSTGGEGTVGFDAEGTVSTFVGINTNVNFFVNPAKGYRTSSITVDGVSKTVTNSRDYRVYQFDMPASHVNIAVTFAYDNCIDIAFDTQGKIDWVISGGVSPNVSVGLHTDSSTGDKSCVFVTPSSVADDDPQAHFDFTDMSTFSADEYKYLTIVAKTTASNNAAGMYFCAGGIKDPVANCYKAWTWNNDGLWHEYVIDLSDLSLWTGTANKIRFDFFEGTTAASSSLMLHSMKFTRTAPNTASVSTDSTSYVVDESITINYSGISSYYSEDENIRPFVAIYAEGTSPGNGKALQYAYVTENTGKLIFPADVTGGTNVGNLPAGNYYAWLSYDATDSSENYIVNNVHMNSCEGYSFTVTKPAAHVCSGTPNEGQDATCTVDGWKAYYSCSCGKNYSDAASTNEITNLDAWKKGDGKIAASHNYGTIVPEDSGKHTASELKDGMKAHYFCEECDTYFTDAKVATTKEALTIKNIHNYNTQYGYKAEEGHANTCTCGAHDTVVGHTADRPAPTETEDQKCSLCEFVIATKTGHIHKNNLTPVERLKATCTVNGYKSYYDCSCGKHFEDASASVEITDLAAWKAGAGKIAAEGHKYTEQKKDVAHLKSEATKCTEFNLYWYDCSVCDANAKDDSEATDKFWTSTEMGDHSFTEKKADAAHLVAGTGANCQDAKKYYFDCAYCDTKGTTIWTSTEMGDHKYTEKLADTAHLVAGSGANCQDAKEYHYDCAHCADIGTTTWVSTEMGDHEYDMTQWGYRDKATGHAHQCKYCSEHDAVQPHTPNMDAPTETEDKVCTACQIVFETATGHICKNHLTKISAQAATCTVDGNIEYYECSCGKYYTDSTASVEINEKASVKVPAGHNYGALVPEDSGKHTASELKDGMKAHYFCEECDTYFTAEKVATTKDALVIVFAHSHGATWESDKDNHWNKCACGDEANTAAHKDANNDGKCDVCEYNVGAPKFSTSDNPQTGDNSNIILWISLLMLSALGVVATTILGKKKYSVK